MRISGFIVGGLIGAAATMYVSRKRPGAMSWAANAISDVSKSAARNSVSKMMSKSIVEEAPTFSPKHSDDTAVKSEDAWGQIEAIVNSDPELKQEADKIKAESSSLSH